MASTDKVTTGVVHLAEISTGDPATVNDAYDATKAENGAKIQVGAALYVRRASDGALIKLRYVRVNSTVPPVAVVGPTYWKDKGRTTVTCVMSEGITATVNSIAGALLNANITNGNFGFIQVAGPLAAMAVVAATALGDALKGAAAQATARTAADTAPTNKVFAWAEQAVGGGVADVYIAVESL